MKFLQIIFSIFLGIFLSACLAKTTPKAKIYELNVNECAKTSLKISQITSSMALNTRSIYIKENNKLKELENAKFVSFGEDMLESALIKYFSCNIHDGKKSLKVALLELYAMDNQAIISIKANINNKEKILSASSEFNTLEADEVVKAMNEALLKLLIQIEEFSNDIL